MTPRRILIVYGTTYGQTEKIAHYLQDVLNADGYTAVVEAADRWRAEWSVDGYDAVVVGGSLIGGRHQRSVSHFLERNAPQLRQIPCAFFSVSGSAAGHDQRALAKVDAIINRLFADTQWHPATVERIGGAMAFTKYALPVKWVMKWISWRSHGPTDTSRDHELTDWLQVRQFAQRVAALAGGAPAQVQPAPLPEAAPGKT